MGGDYRHRTVLWIDTEQDGSTRDSSAFGTDSSDVPSVEVEIENASIRKEFDILQSNRTRSAFVGRHATRSRSQVDTVICETRDLMTAVARLCTSVFVCQTKVSC